MITKRKSNYEWLRILSMIMIITLHYAFKGEAVTNPAENMTASNLIMWFLTAMSICAVNVYVLISGYFLLYSEFRFKRVIDLIIQVLEYSVIVTIVVALTGQVTLSELSIYDWLGLLFPVGTEEYWFITAYILMYLISPLLSAGVKTVDEKTLRYIILTLLGFVCLEKTILPMTLPTDGFGYEVGWFVILFLISAYFRIYGFSAFERKSSYAWITYVCSVVLIWVLNIVFEVAALKTGMATFSHYADVLWDYNSLLVLTGSIGLFVAFSNLQLNESTKRAAFARNTGRLTLGVYLLHEHPLVRYKWQQWLGAASVDSALDRILNWALSVIIIFVIGVTIEAIRTFIMQKFEKE